MKQMTDHPENQKRTSSKTQFPRKYWACFSPSGEILPSTIREKAGDCESALNKIISQKRCSAPFFARPLEPSDYTLKEIFIFLKEGNTISPSIKKYMEDSSNTCTTHTINSFDKIEKDAKQEVKLELKQASKYINVDHRLGLQLPLELEFNTGINTIIIESGNSIFVSSRMYSQEEKSGILNINTSISSSLASYGFTHLTSSKLSTELFNINTIKTLRPELTNTLKYMSYETPLFIYEKNSEGSFTLYIDHNSLAKIQNCVSCISTPGLKSEYQYLYKVEDRWYASTSILKCIDIDVHNLDICYTPGVTCISSYLQLVDDLPDETILIRSEDKWVHNLYTGMHFEVNYK